MSPNYLIRRGAYLAGYLTEPSISHAYVLAQALAADLVEADWRRFCLASMAVREEEGGDKIVMARDVTGYMRGLCVFAVRDGVDGTRRIDVPLFAPLSAADRGGVARALLALLKQVARRLDCKSITFRSLEADEWVRYLAGDIKAGRLDGVTMMVSE